MKKQFVLDTNIILHDNNSLFSFGNNDIILPLKVIEELDRNKDRNDNEAGYNAREVSRKLSILTKDKRDLTKGIPLGEGLGKLFILSIDDLNKSSSMPRELNNNSGDNVILTFCKAYKESYPKKKVILVSRDVLLRIKAEVLNIENEDYRKFNVKLENDKSIYSGIKTDFIGEIDVDKFYSAEPYYLTTKFIEDNNLYPNQFLVYKNDKNKSVLARFISKDKPLKKINENRTSWNIKAKNKEQAFALDLLFDDDIKLVSLCGTSGSGKTLISLSSALEQIISQKKYNKLLITRNPVSVGNSDLGFLPGSELEKLMPWSKGAIDNLELLFNEDVHMAQEKGAVINKKKNTQSQTSSLMMQEYMERGIIQIESLSHIRGRSINKTIILVEEAQNCSAHQIKTLITRVGEESKIILLGDVKQIDDNSLHVFNNGLTVAIEKLKGQEIVGCVELIKGERSKIATLASSIL